MASFSYNPPPLKHTQMTWERIDKYISPIYFCDINLHSSLYGSKVAASSITHCQTENRFSSETISSAKFEAVSVGDTFGPIWSTHWFKVLFQLDNEFLDSLTDDDELLFNWNSNSEATLWNEDVTCPIGAFSCGQPFSTIREFYPVTTKKNRLEFIVEMACNKVLGDSDPLFIGPPKDDATYTLQRCQLIVRNRSVYKLLRDMKIMRDIAKELENQEEGFVALFTANHIVNILQSNQSDKYQQALEISDEFFLRGSNKSRHVIHAIGHCHMDCAWLWPYDETKRKCSRSWSATLDLMERYPEWNFACSSAQQYEWIQQYYPQLYERIKQQVASGRFQPVGGSWVEMDGYLPSGESMCRQMLYGQRFFEKEFNTLCTEFWLPDTFGYSAQLPQIMRHFGMKRFFTQKISWSLINKFPHHTFHWEGIDGTKVLTHFAPGDSYHMNCDVKELIKTLTNFEDKGRSSHSLYLFGHGDGGQGPTQDMLENLTRFEDVNGLPKLQLSSAAEYFNTVERYEAENLCSWSGELYLEMHNGTYTTQGKIKKYNRRCEVMLHNIELISTLNYIYGDHKYPFEELDRLWKSVLLNQFHDVLPGTSIEIVNDNAKLIYKEVTELGRKLLEKNMIKLTDVDDARLLVVFNTLGWPRQEVIRVEEDIIQGLPEQYDLTGKAYQLVTCDGFSVSPPGPMSFCRVTVRKQGEVIVMSNSKVYAEIDRLGRITTLKTKQSDILKTNTDSYSRNLLQGFANQFVLYNDIPLFWDAWDVMGFHQESKSAIEELLFGAIIKEEGPLRASVEISLKISDHSYINQMIILDAESSYLRVNCEVHWHESRKFLKVEFPCDIKSDHVTYETQFGYIRRPNHRNTSWDSAKYEVCSQKWFDLSDYNVGVAILNDCKYGCSVEGSKLSLSLLRSPKYPDAHADMGVHEFSYAILPHKGSFQEAGVIQASYNFNVPLISLTHPVQFKSLSSQVIHSSEPSIIIDTIKVGESDRHGEEKAPVKNIILRCYEAFGGSCTTSITALFPVVSAYECDGLEKDQTKLNLVDGTSTFTVAFTPFQFKTILLTVESNNLEKQFDSEVQPVERQTINDKTVLKKSLSRKESVDAP